jgi:hypothetical protein
VPDPRWYIEAEPGWTEVDSWSAWINPSVKSSRGSFLGVTEAVEDLHVNPEDMDLEPEYIQADEALWTIEKEGDGGSAEGLWAVGSLWDADWYIAADELLTDFYLDRLREVGLWYLRGELEYAGFYVEPMETIPDFYVQGWESYYEWYVRALEERTDFYVDSGFETISGFYQQFAETD